MEYHTILKSVLNDLCDKQKLTSWTLHENSKGTICTIRFSDISAILDSHSSSFIRPRNTTYRRKSEYQVIRDRSRMQDFNESNYFPQTVDRNSLNDNESNSDNQHSDTGLNQQIGSVCSAEANPFRLDEEPTEAVIGSVCSAEAHQFRLDEEPTEAVVECTPLISTQMQSPEDQEPSTDLKPDVPSVAKVYEQNAQMLPPDYLEIDRTQTFDLNSEYDLGAVASLTGSQYPNSESVENTYSNDIICDICSATAPHQTSMLYCEKCYFHMCGACAISNPSNHSIDCRNKLRYMSAAEMYPEIPKNAVDSFRAENSKPPDSDDTSCDQQVPNLYNDHEQLTMANLADVFQEAFDRQFRSRRSALE